MLDGFYISVMFPEVLSFNRQVHIKVPISASAAQFIGFFIPESHLQPSVLTSVGNPLDYTHPPSASPKHMGFLQYPSKTLLRLFIPSFLFYHGLILARMQESNNHRFGSSSMYISAVIIEYKFLFI